jgi:ATP-dependent DNA helicase RecG
LEQIHFPENWDHLRQAQDRLAFDEMFLLQLGVLGQKREWESLQTDPMKVPEEQMDRFLENLPFELTKAQEKSIQAIIQDLASGRPMNRLLQGDVGSGKTVVAAAAIMAAMVNDAQSALMAPTSILAEQHYLTLQKLLPGGAGVSTDSIRLLLGATPESEKHEIRQGLEEGSIKLVIGTHALLEDPISFSRLQLAVIDEQHRFGVNQRTTLRSKGKNPNLLVMTATPIPRSLALTIYGDLDLSIIDEMPPGRQAIETRVLTPLERNRAYQFIKSQIAKGEQAFLIYPLVEESQKIKAKAAVEDYERLQEEVFHDTRIGLLHGRMKPDEKEEVMKGFRDHEFDVLLSTSVVEVGVDVPNATIVLIEGANRFGLSQLHQFRGRVGRRDQKSFCLLIPEQDDEKDNQRLQAMESTQDGFELAEMDLNQRGPGDFLGTRQSGFSELHMAEITDIKLIEKARHEARQLFDTDPDLSQPEHERLAEVMNRFWSHERGEIS